jgi:hypothetical protein
MYPFFFPFENILVCIPYKTISYVQISCVTLENYEYSMFVSFVFVAKYHMQSWKEVSDKRKYKSYKIKSLYLTPNM